MPKELTLFDLEDYLSKLILNYPQHKKFLDELREKICTRISTNNYETLFENEITEVVQYSQKNKSFLKLLTIYTCLKEAYIRFLLNQFKFNISSSLQTIDLLRVYFYVIERVQDNPLEQQNLIQLKDKLIKRLSNFTGQKFLNEMAYFRNELIEISKHLERDNKIFKQMEFKLAEIEEQTKIKPSLAVKKIYKKYQNPEYKVKAINQIYMPIRANSIGLCYGLSVSMAIPGYNLFRNDNRNKFFQITKDVNSIQSNQQNREIDQSLVQRKRISIQHLSPHLLEQSKEILKIAQQNKGKHLLIHLHSSQQTGHVCYMKYVASNEIHYMDSVHGAYCFRKSLEFVEFFIASIYIFPTGKPFTRFQIEELIYAPKAATVETWDEKMITLLTGPKYPDNLYALGMLIFHFLFAQFLLGEKLGYFPALITGIAYIVAMCNRLHGLLAIPNFIKENLIFEFQDLAFNINEKRADAFLANQIKDLMQNIPIDAGKTLFFNKELDKPVEKGTLTKFLL
ncbi:MAG: hypothetical protein H0U57_09155 [Tatlockia sp.]|nr:hypothetical protein [Tatlockia sp.]